MYIRLIFASFFNNNTAFFTNNPKYTIEYQQNRTNTPISPHFSFIHCIFHSLYYYFYARKGKTIGIV